MCINVYHKDRQILHRVTKTNRDKTAHNDKNKQIKMKERHVPDASEFGSLNEKQMTTQSQPRSSKGRKRSYLMSPAVSQSARRVGQPVVNKAGMS
jgi:hypothetical protein